MDLLQLKFTDFDLSTNLIFLSRILISALQGIVIGFEREKRQKAAGLRTHMIVCISATLMVIVSKYGFFDVLPVSDSVRVDVSRISSSVVQAIGFLGAGVILKDGTSTIPLEELPITHLEYLIAEKYFKDYNNSNIKNYIKLKTNVTNLLDLSGEDTTVDGIWVLDAYRDINTNTETSPNKYNVADLMLPYEKD